MKKRAFSTMEIVSAKTITHLVPDDLSALLIADSPTVGPVVDVCAVGDIGLSGRVGDVLRHHANADKMLAEIAPLLRKADITFGNLESPLSGEIANGKMFSAPTTGAAMLKRSGFTLIHLANNHVYDYGQAGLVATIDAVKKANLVPLGVGDNPAGAQKLVRTDTNGFRIGWLGCGRTLVPQSNSGSTYWEFDEQQLFKAVERSRADVDLLVVSIHIGLMYMDYPRPEHKQMAEKLMDAGANLILMHHAHVIQSVQVNSARSMCCYNLGNFLFDWEEGNVKIPIMLREQNEGAVFYFVLDRAGVARAAALPIWIDDTCNVHWAIGTRGVEILNRLARISRDLECDFESIFRRQRAERNTAAISKVMWFHLCRGNLAFVVDSIKKIRLEHVGMIIRWVVGSLNRFMNKPSI